MIVELVVSSSGADLNVLDSQKNTALHLACQQVTMAELVASVMAMARSLKRPLLQPVAIAVAKVTYTWF